MGGELQPITVWENTEQLLEEWGLGSQLGSSVGMSPACSRTLDMSKICLFNDSPNPLNIYVQMEE